MKLSDITAKLTCSIRNMNGKATRILAATALAGAALATVPAAQAQHFAVGVQIGGPRFYAPSPRFVGPVYGGRGYGGPVYGGPVYGGPVYGQGFWEHRRFEDWRRHESFEHHRGFYGPRY